MVSAVLLNAGSVCGQHTEPQPLRLEGIQAGGVRSTLTEAWGKLDFRLTNTTDTDRHARVIAFYENRPAAQYGRVVWVPAHATIASWLPIGPAPPQASMSAREFQLLLHDLTDGKDMLVLPPTAERIRSGAAIYKKRDSATALVIDAYRGHPPAFGEFPAPEARGDEAFELARAFRASQELSDHVYLLDQQALPRWPKAFDGIDHVVLASGRANEDPAGMQALRQWLEQGGRVWVMLDRVKVEALASLLNEALDFELAGRVGLTEFRLEEVDAEPVLAAPSLQRHEHPVDFVRVLLPPGERVRHTVAGWPAWFTRSVGRGKVLVTTLGPRGWYRPGTARAPSEALRLATTVLQVRSAEPPPVEAFEGLLTQAIGYSVIPRHTAFLVYAAFVVGILGLGALAKQLRKLQWRAWVAPGSALATAVVLLLMGESARRSAPPTIAFAQVIDAVAGTDEAAVRGLLAIYRPDSGPLDAGASQGGFFGLDLAGIEDRTRRLIMTDLDSWHWENLSLPVGVRFAPLQFTARTASPFKAVARIGSNGIDGRILAEGVENLGDAVVAAPGARSMALRLQPGATFSCSSADTLPIGQYLAGTLLSDRQQQQQQIVRRFLSVSPIESQSDLPVVMAWADPLEMPFQLQKGARIVGTAFVCMPLHLERAAPGTSVAIPGPLVAVHRKVGGALARPVLESTLGSEQELRFQIPSAVLPLKVERARLRAKIDCRTRQVAIAARANGKPIELHRRENPLGPIEVDITDQRLLRPDPDGGLHFNLTISEPLHTPGARPAIPDATPEWKIEYIELEVVGTTDGPGADRNSR
jgi:hypothetical protein